MKLSAVPGLLLSVSVDEFFMLIGSGHWVTEIAIRNERPCAWYGR